MKPRPSKKRKTPSPKKSKLESRSILEQLLKPVQVHELPRKMADALAQLPADIAPLYKQVLTVPGAQNIPHEVYEEVAELVPVQKWYFRDPDPAEDARDQALKVFNELTTILDKASQAQTHRRHEAAWYIHVHSPLLELVFSWRVPKPNEITKPCARVESVMSATIAGNSIPLRRSDPNSAPEPACSVSLDSELFGSDTSKDSWVYPPSDWSMSQVRSHNAKVDFVVALDIPDETRLRKVISWTIDDAGSRRHVNQTTYAPLKESPIAISMEMKTEASPFQPLHCPGSTANPVTGWYWRLVCAAWFVGRRLAQADVRSSRPATYWSQASPGVNPLSTGPRAPVEHVFRV